MEKFLISKTHKGIRSIGGFVRCLSDERKKFSDNIAHFLEKMPNKNSKKTKENIEMLNSCVLYFTNFLEYLEKNAGKNVSKLETYLELLQEVISAEPDKT